MEELYQTHSIDSSQNTPPPQQGETQTGDLLVMGGGMAGLSFAIAVAQAGLNVIVLEQSNPAELLEDPHDGRSSAIAQGPAEIWKMTGVWEAVKADAQPIEDIRVSDGPSQLFLHYAHKDLGLHGKEGGLLPLGYIIQNQAIRRALFTVEKTVENLTLVPNARLKGPGNIVQTKRHVEVTLQDGRRFSAPLLVAADGRGSMARQAAGIPLSGWSYHQTGIVCTVHHEKPHQATAHERFLPSGPFALLPMVAGPDHPYRSSLVWTEKDRLVPSMMALSDHDFAMELEKRFGPWLGWLRPMGKRFAYPLSLQHAHRYAAGRIVLLGDAAHGIHPISGQGLNLGLRDVAALAEILVDAARLGQDLASPDLMQRYEAWRRFDNLVMISVTDSLNRLFSNDVLPIKVARDLGLAAVDRIPPLKRLFMRHAMGVVGDLPRLMRGQPL